MTFSDTKISLGETIEVTQFASLKPEHLDLGHQHLAVLSAMNCEVRAEGQQITSASVHFYSLASGEETQCWNLETVLRETSTVAWHV